MMPYVEETRISIKNTLVSDVGCMSFRAYSLNNGGGRRFDVEPGHKIHEEGPFLLFFFFQASVLNWTASTLQLPCIA